MIMLLDRRQTKSREEKPIMLLEERSVLRHLLVSDSVEKQSNSPCSHKLFFVDLYGSYVSKDILAVILMPQQLLDGLSRNLVLTFIWIRNPIQIDPKIKSIAPLPKLSSFIKICQQVFEISC